MRMQSRNTYANGDGLDDLDPYMTCPEAVICLVHLERAYLPKFIWEPMCGTGAIVRVLQAAGYDVIASDIYDYGCEGAATLDYFDFPAPDIVQGIVSNPAYDRAGSITRNAAEKFARKAIAEVPYAALLLRTNFLEAARRRSFFGAHPPTRILIASRRLPMMRNRPVSQRHKNVRRAGAGCHTMSHVRRRRSPRKEKPWRQTHELPRGIL